MLQERRTAPAPWKDNLPLFPGTWGVVYFLLRPAAGRALPASQERGSGAEALSPGGGVSVGTRSWWLLPACRGSVSKPRTPDLGLGRGDLVPGLGHLSTPPSASSWAPAFPAPGPDLHLLAFRSCCWEMFFLGQTGVLQGLVEKQHLPISKGWRI